MKRYLRFLFLLGISIVGLVAAYTFFDNQRVAVVRQDVAIADLPAAFEGFTILQISDLHGRRFGRHQARLLAKINGIDYDLLAITGDMSDGYGGPPDNAPFFELLEGIENQSPVFYATGNTGPYGVDPLTGALTEEGRALEARGVDALTRPIAIERGGQRIWVGDFWLVDWLRLYNVGFSEQRLADPALPVEERSRYEDAIENAQELIDDLAQIGSDDTLIGITHVPFSIDAVSGMPAIDPPYDLVLAGHYHGGQIRLPLVGALYIPDGAAPRRGWFPPRDRVSGLRDWGVFQQYISRGLGASSSLPFLDFRLFNTPEINVITLRRGS